MLDFSTLAARSLNACRNVHKPSYVGLRLLLSSARLNPAPFTKWIEKRVQTRESWRYYSFPILKEAASGKPIVYRNCLSNSPITAAAESYVLTLMAAEPAFQTPSCAYSYLWPRNSRAGSSFEYFMDGYTRRNHTVSELLAENTGLVAVVADIKAFYPSVDKDRLLKKLRQRVSKVSDPGIANAIGKFSNSFLSINEPSITGIPIGPGMSHVLGHIALDSVDTVMAAEYGRKYLRYVDDIVVVCTKSEAANVTNRLRSALVDEGLSLHEGKQDEVLAAEWSSHGVAGAASLNIDVFRQLVDSIVLYILKTPNDFANLRGRLLDQGFSFPMRRLESLCKSERYKYHLISRWRANGGLVGWIKNIFVSIDDIVRIAVAVRSQLLDTAGRLAEDPIPDQPTARRFYVQKRRFLLNRLLYLLSPERYPTLLQLTPSINEFYDNRLVALALSSGDCSEILRHSGRVIDTFCQLWNERNGSSPPRWDWPSYPTRAEAESIAHMALYFPVTPPALFSDRLASTAPGTGMLIDICSRSPVMSKMPRPFSHLDEMELLFRGASSEVVQNLVTSRFDELEDVGLDALLLGDSASPFAFDGGGYAT